MRLNQRAENIVLPLGAIVISLLIGAVMIRLNGSNPWTAYKALIDGALGGKEELARTLSKATPLIFTSTSRSLCSSAVCSACCRRPSPASSRPTEGRTR